MIFTIKHTTIECKGILFDFSIQVIYQEQTDIARFKFKLLSNDNHGLPDTSVDILKEGNHSSVIQRAEGGNEYIESFQRCLIQYTDQFSISNET